MIQTVSHIQTQTINIKLFYPTPDGIKNMLDYLLIAQIQLYKIIIAFPALIPQTIIVVGVAVKGDTSEPVHIR